MSTIELRPMSSAEYDGYFELLTHEYAKEKVASGNWPAEGAIERAVAEQLQLLPEGTNTPNHYLFSVVAPDEAEPVGILWYAVRGEEKPFVWVYDIMIHDAYRRRGYASQAFEAMEAQVQALGIDSIQLHVFGFNRGAQAMYEKLGYEVTNLQMRKTLPKEE